jgi:hypothetical protein
MKRLGCHTVLLVVLPDVYLGRKTGANFLHWQSHARTAERGLSAGVPNYCKNEMTVFLPDLD